MLLYNEMKPKIKVKIYKNQIRYILKKNDKK